MHGTRIELCGPYSPLPSAPWLQHPVPVEISEHFSRAVLHRVNCGNQCYQPGHVRRGQNLSLQERPSVTNQSKLAAATSCLSNSMPGVLQEQYTSLQNREHFKSCVRPHQQHFFFSRDSASVYWPVSSQKLPLGLLGIH